MELVNEQLQLSDLKNRIFGIMVNNLKIKGNSSLLYNTKI